MDQIESVYDITLDFVKQYMRIDHDLDDLELDLYLRSAINYVTKYVGETFIDDVDLVMPVLMLISHFYENKTPMNDGTSKYDYIFRDILWMNRGLVI